MSGRSDRKLYLGPRLRMLRRELGLNQTRMAEELGVSPSYLNHLERNQRPLTAQMLLRLAETYNLDLRGFVGGAQDAAASDLGELLSDDLVRDLGIGRQEALEVAENYPGVAEAMKRFYQALTDLRRMSGGADMHATGDGAAASPIAWARDWLEGNDTHFPDLDREAEALSATLGKDAEAIRHGAVARLAEQHRVSVRIVSEEVLAGARRHYDFHRRRLMLSERLTPAARSFGIAVQLAQLELAEPIAAALAAAAPPDAEAKALALAMLTNYAAAAVLMPYARFHAAAEASRYDDDLLADRFGTSLEQVAHRLTSLGRATMRGVPLFLLKLDVAGNVVKRYAGSGAPFARFGGGCPRWRAHDALRRAGEVVADLVELPDGARHFTWARALDPSRGRQPGLLVLGCRAEDAARIGHADGVTTPNPIGPACHLCERVNCRERSMPPRRRALSLNPYHAAAANYPFRPI